jgi:hypothetical protein
MYLGLWDTVNSHILSKPERIERIYLMVFDKNRMVLNDEPAYVDLILQQQTSWSRVLQIIDRETEEVRGIQGRTFIGTIRDSTLDAVGEFDFVVNIDDSFEVSLTKAAILDLTVGAIHTYDIFLIEPNGEGEKIMTGNLVTVYSNTEVP